ncbi:MAG: phytanoyl-CoA dioxygenase family protein, partial [Rhodospirillales bacterium]
MTNTAEFRVPVVSPLLKRAGNRIQRFSFERAYRRNRRKHLSQLPEILSTARTVVGALENDGAFVTSLSELGLTDVDGFLKRARMLFSQMASGVENADMKKAYVIHDPPGLLAQFPDVLSLGLNPLWLDIVESYLGLPPAFRGGTARRDLADGRAVETRLWHLDDEDKRIVKFIVYIDDVDEHGGGFEFVPKTKLPKEFKRYRRVDDDEMMQNVPKADWVKCFGPAGTVVIGDTC